MSNKSNGPRVVELFAGVGGFRLGLEAAGWSTVWSNQWEPSTKAQHASACYIANFGGESHSNMDIAEAVELHKVGGVPIPEADMIVGGFPCQDYSVAKSAGSSQGLKGKKGVLWWEIHKLVALTKPKLVFLENVDRLLKSPASQRGRDFAVMLRTLGDLGYVIEWRVVNAADYGFPQRRIRVFIVAIRLDVALSDNLKGEDYFERGILPKSFPVAAYSSATTFQIAHDPEHISSHFNLDQPKSPFLGAGFYSSGTVYTAKPETRANNPKTLKSVLISDSEVPDEYWISSEKLSSWQFLKGAKSIARVAKSGHRYNYSEGKMAFPDSLDKPSRTILTGEGGSTPSRFKHVIETKRGHRRLTPLELERLSGFPDDWTRFGADGVEISDSKRAFFMGNALVVGLVEMVGAELRQRFFSS
jgi:DNA (cytosine-5)-methyltransferase 1